MAAKKRERKWILFMFVVAISLFALLFIPEVMELSTQEGGFSSFFALSFNNEFFTTAAVGILNAGNASQCGGINTSITLNNNVNSTGTCFAINASNIILDCRGYEINYSSGGACGFGINNTGFNNVTIRNCIIKEGSNAACNNKHGILLNNAHNGTIYNNTITLVGDANHGIYLFWSNNTNVSYNAITSSGVNSAALVLRNASSSTLYSNNITVTGDSSEGIILHDFVTANLLNSNTLLTRFAPAILITDTVFFNIFVNNTFGSEKNYSILDETDTSLFNLLVYNNSLGEILWNLSNLTTDLNLTPGVTIFVQNNLIGILEDSAIMRL